MADGRRLLPSWAHVVIHVRGMENGAFVRGWLRSGNKISWNVRLVLSLLSIIQAAILWDYVNLPYSNPHNIVGILSQNEFNPTTNTVRFTLFVLFPSFTWALLKRVSNVRGHPLPAGSPTLEELSREWPFWALVTVSGIGLLLAILSGVQRLVSNLSWFYLDLFHDGDALAPALNWAMRGHLWTENYLTHGPFTDVISTWLGWQIFGRQTIGAFKAVQFLLDAAVPVGLTLLVLCLQYSLRGVATRVERAILTALSFSILYWGQDGYVWFQSRTLSVVLSLSALSLAFGTKRPVWFFAAGAFATFALFTSSDVGIYCIASSVLAIGVFAVGPSFREYLRDEIFPWVLGLASGHLAVLLIFGQPEYMAWISQIVSTATRWDFVYSYIYPSPSDASKWATHAWPMVLLALIVMGFTIMFPAYRSNPNLRTQGQIHLLLVGITVFAYRTAIGRSDLAHISQGLAFGCFGFAFSLWLLARFGATKVQCCLLALTFIPLLGALALVTADGGRGRFANAFARLSSYAYVGDAKFLTQEQRSAQTEFLRIFKDDECVFVFPNEPAWYFLVRKPACGRFFFTVHAMGDDRQAEIVRTLADKAPQHILYSSPIPTHEVDGIPNSTRLPRLDSWIRERYRPIESVQGWVVYQLR
jgi:hypothetical protein